jgi:hypothetical protein
MTATDAAGETGRRVGMPAYGCGDGGQETGDRRQKTEDRRQETIMPKGTGRRYSEIENVDPGVEPVVLLSPVSCLEAHTFPLGLPLEHDWTLG